MASLDSPSGNKSKSFWLAFGGMWLLIGAVFLLVGVGMIKADRRFAKEGVTVSGEVIGKNVERSTKRIKQANGTYKDEVTESYKVLYGFVTADGQKIEGSDYIGQTEWTGVKAGDPISARYLSGEPQQNRLAGGSHEIGAFIFAGLGFALVLLGGAVCFFGIRGKTPRGRLASQGVSPNIA